MQILVARQLDGGLPEDYPRSWSVLHRPDLESPDAALAGALTSIRPTVLITRQPLNDADATAWRRAVSAQWLIAISADGPIGAQYPGILQQTCRSADATTLLGRAERLCALVSVKRSSAGGTARPRSAGQVVMVGAGIVNLVTALGLIRAGFDLEILDAGPDPRARAPWNAYGCTMGGENARMFSLTEADAYPTASGGHPDDRPAEGGAAFTLPASDGGWNARPRRALDCTERYWLALHRATPRWLSRVYAADIYHFNRESERRWDHLRRHDPAVFRGAVLRDGIVRIYEDPGRLSADVRRHRHLLAAPRTLTPEQLASRHPALAEAVDGGVVAGALEVPGFTVNVHNVMANLVDCLAAAGARFRWWERVRRIQWSSGRCVRGLDVAGTTIDARHYVISPGASSGSLLSETLAGRLIQGVLGVWYTLPNVKPQLRHSLKISRSEPLAADTNVTVGRDRTGEDVLFLGSGYGWTGAATAPDPDELRLIADATRETSRRYFPSAYADRQRAGDADEVRFCVRPWTPSSLGIFEMYPTHHNGLMIITGGHNTGGFAQAPAIAAAVLAALQGRRHLMHALYDPARSDRLAGPDL